MTLFCLNLIMVIPYLGEVLFIIDIFYPTGELISLQRLRCSPFAVDFYSFMGHCLAAAASSTRE